jgi:hypothetical protein
MFADMPDCILFKKLFDNPDCNIHRDKEFTFFCIFSVNSVLECRLPMGRWSNFSFWLGALGGLAVQK